MEQHHCPECRKAVLKERARLVPFMLYFFYLTWSSPGPLPHPGAEIAAGLLFLSLFFSALYFQRHP